MSSNQLVQQLVTWCEDAVNVSLIVRQLNELQSQLESSEFAQQELGSANDAALIKCLGSLLKSEGSVFVGWNNEDKRLVLTACLWVLVRFCRRALDKSTACQANITQVEAFMDSIVTTMNEHIDSALVVHPCCWLIMILASESSERQNSLIALGVGAPVVQALTMHAINPDIAEFGCRCVRNLSIEDENAAQLVESGVCIALENVSKVYLQQVEPDNMAVYEAIMWAIVNLSCDEQISSYLGAAGCCEVVVQITARARRHESTVFAAVSALRNLTTLNSLNYARFAETAVCEVLLAVVREFTEAPRTVDVALWALANLGCDLGLATRVVDQAGVEQVLESLRIIRSRSQALESPYIAFGPTAEAALWCLRNIAGSCVEKRSHLGAVGSVKEIGIVANTYRDREGMVELALAALNNICDRCAENAIRVREEQILPMICEMVQQHGAVVEVAEFGLKLLGLLARMDDESREILSGGVSVTEGVEPMPILKIALQCIFGLVGEPDVFRFGCDIALVIRYRDEEKHLSLREQGLLMDETPGVFPRAKQPSGKFHTMVAAWGLDALATELNVDMHPENWDPRMIVSVPQSMLGSLLGGQGAGENPFATTE